MALEVFPRGYFGPGPQEQSCWQGWAVPGRLVVCGALTGSAAGPWLHLSLEILPGFKLCNEKECKKTLLHTHGSNPWSIFIERTGIFSCWY